MIRLLLALWLGKIVSFLTLYLKKGGGSAAPGYYALKFDPGLVKKLSKKINTNIVVTGTNGKTTTSRLIAHFAKTNGVRFIRNSTGSNLERGVASALINNSNWLGDFKDTGLGIWELDEAAFNSVALDLNPKVVIFLNAFRDQLDRYGEVDTVVKKWKTTLTGISPESALIINGDDQNTSQLATEHKGKKILFGLDKHKIKGESIKGSQPASRLDVTVKNIKETELDSTAFVLSSKGGGIDVTLPLPGIYNIYNFIAAFLTGRELNFSGESMVQSLKSFTPAFGRFEKVALEDKKEAYIFLIKNPVGASEVFKTIAKQLSASDRLLMALNDNFADGTDVSWIWDAEFEAISSQPSALKVICSGSRAYDLAVRLKYSGVDDSNLTVETSLKKALEAAKKGLEGRLFVLPTYTALLELQSILTKSGVKQHYWKE